MTHSIKISETKTAFLKHIAYLQIIGILLVVFGHSFHQFPDGQHGATLLVYRMMYNFRMPLFMFVSGFLMVHTTSRKNPMPSWTDFVRLKLRRLLLPFLILSTFTFVPRALMSGLADDSITLSFHSFLRSLLFADSMTIPYYWFLQASFVLLVLCYSVSLLLRKNSLSHRVCWLVVSALFAVLMQTDIDFHTFFSLDDVVRLGVFFTLGCAYHYFKETVERNLPLTQWWFFIVVAVVWSALFLWVQDTRLYPIASAFGILMCISLAMILESKQFTILDHLIGANYLIFLLSWFFNVGSQQVLSHYISWPWWGYSVLSFFTGVYLPLLLRRLMQKYDSNKITHIISWCLGQ